jgi:hypothetical protein
MNVLNCLNALLRLLSLPNVMTHHLCLEDIDPRQDISNQDRVRMRIKVINDFAVDGRLESLPVKFQESY